jgi:hypothetical protein
VGCRTEWESGVGLGWVVARDRVRLATPGSAAVRRLTHLTLGMDGENIWPMSAQPSPVSPRPWSMITVPLCSLDGPSTMGAE